MKNLMVIFVLALIFATSCQTEKVVIKEVVVHDTIVKESFSYDYMLMAVLWYQASAEMRAMCYQSFNLAKLMLDQAVALNKPGKPLAIVTDIDETIVDNSPYEAQNVLGNFGYPVRWSEWISAAKAAAIPGAVEFMNYAVSKGVAIYYISNRKVGEMDATIQNMQNLGFPMADEAHLLLRDKTSGKEERRQKVLETYNIVLLLGDNLNDFSEVFEKKSVDDRFDATDSLKLEFGKRFIVLPNPMYGDWEGAALNYNYGLSNEAKDSIRKINLQGF
ncbi:MAG: 5'-nucleotidase, lipoprotein e(P4) family [Bacteroidetes bacterium HGW-Bacteroidetes-6]|jgi:5'-nucleotidase (lipoprotein e(P4) family)|nr:MAG: 5'-nucleotidase, lipoprotein e(P4) family [Bacteroidetes bacterium HGW-Bacteroidetes-6]